MVEGLLTVTGLTDMIEAKDNDCVDVRFLFVALW